MPVNFPRPRRARSSNLRSPATLPVSKVTDSFDEPDTWEQEIGLDEVIERPRHAFEVAGMDGIDLKAPTLLDLLSDEPIEGAIEPVVSPDARKGLSAGKDSNSKEKVSI
ncbi:hypothetical protein FRC11_011137 [Ceratobasidium sp. 423]|nr:hypothetical protein FRC11_011137 [Ceratobasidium sp. 423]